MQVGEVHQPFAVDVTMADFDVHVLGGADVTAGRGLGEEGREGGKENGNE